MSINKNITPGKQYTEEEVKSWLSWLAKGMKNHGQMIFLIEQLQPTWLSNKRQQRGYILLSFLIFGLVTGLVTSLGLGVILCSGDVMPRADAIFIVTILGVGVGVSVAATHIIWIKLGNKPWFSSVSWVNKIIIFVLISTLVFLIIIGINGFMVQQERLGVIYGMIFGLTHGLVLAPRAIHQSPKYFIETTEKLAWSWPFALKGMGYGLLLGVVVGIVDIIFLESENGLLITVTDGLAFAIGGGLLAGFRKKPAEVMIRANKGILLTMQNTFVVSTIAFILLGLIFALIGSVRATLVKELGLEDPIIIGLMGGFAGGFACFVWFGGMDIIRHYTLRFMLYRREHIPWNLSHFLDYTSTELTFLRKVGGGYMFIHRFLLEHFAGMDPQSSALASSNQQV